MNNQPKTSLLSPPAGIGLDKLRTLIANDKEHAADAGDLLPEAAMFDLLQRYASAVGTHSAVETLRMAACRVDRGEFASEATKRIEACALREQVRDAIKALYSATSMAAPASAQPVAAAPADFVLMPKRLTAENGAKGALSGEFKESIDVTCHACGGSGDDDESDNDAECAECKGDGIVTQDVSVSWDTIKDVYKRAVELLSAPAAPVAQALPVELMGVREEMASGSGFWQSCSGCYDTEDGHPTGPYSYSTVFGCALGSGCSECGGLGVVWDDTDYEAMEKEDAVEAAQATTASASDIDLADMPAATSAGASQGQAGGDDARDAAPAAKIGPERDPLYEQAVMVVRAGNRGSISMVQRHLMIGYNRASRLIEAMEADGIVSPLDGNGHRAVLPSTQHGAKGCPITDTMDAAQLQALGRQQESA